MRKISKLFGIHTIAYSIILALLCIVNYIDLSVIGLIYFPIFLFSAFLMVFKKIYLSHIFILSAEIGITLEYLISLSNKTTPNMKGASLNISILFIGFIIGIIVQIYMHSKKQ